MHRLALNLLLFVALVALTLLALRAVVTMSDPVCDPRRVACE